MFETTISGSFYHIFIDTIICSRYAATLRQYSEVGLNYVCIVRKYLCKRGWGIDVQKFTKVFRVKICVSVHHFAFFIIWYIVFLPLEERIFLNDMKSYSYEEMMSGHMKSNVTL